MNINISNGLNNDELRIIENIRNFKNDPIWLRNKDKFLKKLRLKLSAHINLQNHNNSGKRKFFGYLKFIIHKATFPLEKK